jgi:hypothetical protein
MPQKTAEKDSTEKEIFPESGKLKRFLFYTKDEMEGDLRREVGEGRFGRPLRDEDIRAFVNLGKKHGLGAKEFVLFMRYYDAGVPEQDFRDFQVKRDLLSDGLAVRYGFEPKEAAILSKAKAELNGRPEFRGRKMTIDRIVSTVQTMETQEDLIKKPLQDPGLDEKSRAKYERMVEVDDTLRRLDASGTVRKKIMDYYRR